MSEPQRWLVPAQHIDEPEAALVGWSAADLDDSELVDDQFIEADPDSWVFDDDEEQDVDLVEDYEPLTATRGQLTWAEVLHIVKRTGVENWVGKDYNGNTVRGQVIAAPSSWRGKKGSMGTVVGVTRHHTGTPETYSAASDYPTYNVVKEGRTGLDNSLSAYGLGRWYGIYVFSEFLSWHAGSWSFAGITDGNGHFLGIEAEGTGARWTAFQNEFYPRLVASILSYIGEGTGMAPRHADGAMPRGRKSDAANLPADFMTKVAGYMANPSTLAYGSAPEPTPAPSPISQEDVDMLRIRNSAGRIVFLTGGFAVHVPDHASNKALADAGVKIVQVHDNFFNALVKAANIDEASLVEIAADLADEEPAKPPVTPTT
jgi:hypothetical protein